MTRVGGSIFIPGPTTTPFPFGSPAEPITMGAAPCSPSWAAVFDSGRPLAPGFDGRRSKLAIRKTGPSFARGPRPPTSEAASSRRREIDRGNWGAGLVAGADVDEWPASRCHRLFHMALDCDEATTAVPPSSGLVMGTWRVWGRRGRCGNLGYISTSMHVPSTVRIGESGARLLCVARDAGHGEHALPCLVLLTPCSLGLRLWGGWRRSPRLPWLRVGVRMLPGPSRVGGTTRPPR